MNILENKSQMEWAEYSTIQPPSTLWQRIEKGGNRYYAAQLKDSIAIGCGITTVISLSFGESPFLTDWKNSRPNWKVELKEMADYGTLCHIGMKELIVNSIVPLEFVKYAQDRFGKGEQFKKDMLSIKKFLIDNKVKVFFLEGILGREYTSINGTKQYICSAIDLFCELEIEVKTKESVQDGMYVRGENKGEPKYKEVTTITTEKQLAIIDLKSNFDAKDDKSFFDSHKSQLIFGRQLISDTFNYPSNDIKMYNLSTLGWRTEPKYILKEHKDNTNSLGYSDSFLLDNRINTALIEGITAPKGTIFKINDEITMDSKKEYESLSYEEYAFQLLNK